MVVQHVVRAIKLRVQRTIDSEHFLALKLSALRNPQALKASSRRG